MAQIYAFRTGFRCLQLSSDPSVWLQDPVGGERIMSVDVYRCIIFQAQPRRALVNSRLTSG